MAVHTDRCSDHGKRNVILGASNSAHKKREFLHPPSSLHSRFTSTKAVASMPWPKNHFRSRGVLHSRGRGRTGKAERTGAASESRSSARSSKGSRGALVAVDQVASRIGLLLVETEFLRLKESRESNSNGTEGFAVLKAHSGLWYAVCGPKDYRE